MGDYIQGSFVIPKDRSQSFVKINPGNTKDVIGEFSYSFNHIHEATQAAKKAFLKWRLLPQSERAQFLKKLYSEIESQSGALAQLISRETGKPLWESNQEVRSLLGKITITLEEGAKLIEPKEVPNAQPNILGRYSYKPKGVMVVLGPFNFPAHLPHGHYIPALFTGNTVILKPSESTPATGQKIAELFHRSQFPPGVFNLVQGEKEVGKRLCLHKDIDGILFTGSYEVGLTIKQEVSTHFWKTVVLEMGGKNASIVLDDANIDKALYENLKGAYLTTGQRCSATSRLILTQKIADQFLERFHHLSKEIKIGYAFEKESPFMGPLINEGALDKYLRFQGIAQREGADLVMRGKRLELSYSGYYVSPSIHLVKSTKESSVYLESEIFGPNVAVIVVNDLEEAIAEANHSDYGLVTSIFTQNKSAYEKVLENVTVGLVNWNRSTVGASSRLPFGGQKKSGNQFPTGLFAPYYCTYPVSCLEDTEDHIEILPGMPGQDQL